MLEEENLYSRKARFCDGKDRFMKKRILTTALCLLLALICVFTLASCDAGNNSAMKDSMSEEILKPGQGGDLELDLNGSTIDKGESTTDRKIIKTAYVSAETKDFEDALKLVEELCAEAKAPQREVSASTTVPTAALPSTLFAFPRRHLTASTILSAVF